MLTSLTNFVGNLGHCGCLSVILIWNGGVVWPESELQRDRMLGRQALNRNMCLRRKRSSHWPKLFLWTNQRSWLGELPSLPVWTCGWGYTDFAMWLGPSYLGMTRTLDSKRKNTWMEMNNIVDVNTSPELSRPLTKTFPRSFTRNSRPKI